jgi:hypothetical protein
MNRTETLLQEYKETAELRLKALESGTNKQFVYYANYLSYVRRQLHNLGINQATIDRLVAA